MHESRLNNQVTRFDKDEIRPQHVTKLFLVTVGCNDDSANDELHRYILLRCASWSTTYVYSRNLL
jgi:hypothetical protein